MERRFFFAILLSFVVLYGYQALFVPPPPKSAQSTASAPAASTAPKQAAAQASAASTAEPRPVNESAPVEGEGSEREIVVDTTTMQVVLTNRGGRVLHWRLKGYQDQKGNMVDLVPTDVPAEQALPFS